MLGACLWTCLKAISVNLGRPGDIGCIPVRLANAIGTHPMHHLWHHFCAHLDNGWQWHHVTNKFSQLQLHCSLHWRPRVLRLDANAPWDRRCGNNGDPGYTKASTIHRERWNTYDALGVNRDAEELPSLRGRAYESVRNEREGLGDVPSLMAQRAVY
jgi:hypothetical protein